MSKSLLEAAFIAEWKRLGGDELERERRVCDERKWRFDFFHAKSNTAIEVDGGSMGLFKKNKYGQKIWVSGRHQSAVGYKSDCEKLNTATLMGVKVFRLTGEMVTNCHLLRSIVEFTKK